jgi:hypothetical protein
MAGMAGSARDAAVRQSSPVREWILAAADEYFYAEGIRAVSADRLIAEAGVSKGCLLPAFSLQRRSGSGLPRGPLGDRAPRAGAVPCPGRRRMRDARRHRACDRGQQLLVRVPRLSVHQRRGRVPRTREAIREHVAAPLGLTVSEAAIAIHEVQNAQAGDLLRRAVVQAGYDPRDFVAYAFGGAGPAHCAGYCRDLGVAEAGVQAITYRMRARATLGFPVVLPDVPEADDADPSAP